jgi:hypothetical protein
MKSPVWLWLLLIVLALVAVPLVHSPQTDAQSTRNRVQRDIEQVFSAHEDLILDARTAANRVKETGSLSLVTSTHDFELQLRPNDLRAPNYRAEEVSSDGVTRPVDMGPITTYKGNVEGVWASDARFTLNGDSIEGMIITPTDSYFIESAQKYSAAAQPSDYLLYKASDVRPEITRVCGTLDEEVAQNAKQIFSSSASTEIAPEVFSPFKVVEIATESDFEYTSALGGSSAANNDILSIMNQIQAIYERDIGLTFTVVFQHTWADANDPYTTNGDPVAMLQEFRDVWNRTFTANPRDVAHLWTGRNLGGPSGLAFAGVVCKDPSASYGASDLETDAPFRVSIPAHEIGHNLGATHCDGQADCDNTLMVGVQNQSNSLSFCPFSVNEITSFVTANSGCLTDAVASNPIDQADFFVRQHYTDFLNRAPDQSGLDFWTRNITDCGSNQSCTDTRRIDTSAAFFLSIEFQQTGYLVERIYKTAFGDAQGTSTFNGQHTLTVPFVRFASFITDTTTIGNGVVVGQGDWQTVLNGNKDAFCANFVNRQDFVAKYPATIPPATFVQTLNQNAGNPLSATELATLIAEHTAGTKNRAQVLRQIAEHQNLANAEFNRAFVMMQFFGYLRRNPNDKPDSDYTGYDFWLTKLNQFNGDFRAAEMVKAFITSLEYRRRFGAP